MLDEGHIEEMAAINQMAIRVSMNPPLMVVEVVSPYGGRSDANYRRDYEDKRQHYQQRGIPEYWIIDPTAQQVTVLVLVDGQYQASVFKETQMIVSATFPELEVIAKDVLLV